MFTIIDATEELYPVIQSLAHKTWPNTFGAILSNEQIRYMLEWMYSITSIKEQVEKKNHHYILLKKGDEFTGYASYENNYENEGNTKLHKIYVLPDEQKTGAGKLLMDEVIRRTALAHNENLLLNVNRENQAIGFYKKKGFEIIKTEDIDIGNGYFMNDYVMRLKVEGRE
ncbi:MAG TPA: GNAT family N-acetyltransferase [Bacteroidales bacterium]|nr:GNAT family N-acetyltransferase [Bacteroidales bacterium]